jgi:hypothetical protein
MVASALREPTFLGEGHAQAVAADGATVVGYTSSPFRAFIWDSVNGMRNLQNVLVSDYGLDLTGWTLEAATDISPNGRTIVGNGTNPNGDLEAWIAIIPGPATACIDGLDNDGDGFTDYPDDPGCADADDLSERSPLLICDDGSDNDGDGLIVCPGEDGGFLEVSVWRRRVFANIARKVVGKGRTVTPHTLRHTYASIHLSRGTDLLWVQRQGGWQSPTVLLSTYAGCVGLSRRKS